MRIIITGGSGFIGSHLIEALKKNGYKNLVVIDKNKPTDKNISFIKGDFSANKILRNTIKNNDIIVHLACSTIPSTSEQNKEKDIMENVIGAVRLLENCRGKKLKNFIFFLPAARSTAISASQRKKLTRPNHLTLMD